MNKKSVYLCKECGEPIISTFLYNGYEYYCLWCGERYEFFNDCVKTTSKKYLVKQKINENIFKIIRSKINVNGQKSNCKKCKNLNEPHCFHLTNKEILENEIALEYLNKIIKKER